MQLACSVSSAANPSRHGYMVMAYVAMAYIATTYIVMASAANPSRHGFLVMAYIVMASAASPSRHVFILFVYDGYAMFALHLYCLYTAITTFLLRVHSRCE